MLLNEGRYRTFERVVGLPRDQANLATLVAVLALGHATGQRLRGLRLAPPSFPEVAFGSAALRELMLGPPKPGVPNAPAFSGLAVIAVGAAAAIAISKSTQGIRGASRAFIGRYGHRARRARGAITDRARQLTARGDQESN